MQRDKNGRRVGKRAYPLRKVVQRNVPGEIAPGVFLDRTHLLECGHHVAIVYDAYGETCPEKQRCRPCYERARIDLDQ